MDWYEYTKDFAESLSSVGGFAIFGSLWLAALGTAVAQSALRKHARSALSPIGVALAAVAGFWLWSAISVYISIQCGGYENAWIRFWYIQPLGTVLLPLLTTLLAIKHGYKCSWEEAFSALGVFAVTALIGFFMLAWFAPNYLTP